jgi:hypothetical protein
MTVNRCRPFVGTPFPSPPMHVAVPSPQASFVFALRFCVLAVIRRQALWSQVNACLRARWMTQRLYPNCTTSHSSRGPASTCVLPVGLRQRSYESQSAQRMLERVVEERLLRRTSRPRGCLPFCPCIGSTSSLKINSLQPPCFWIFLDRAILGPRRFAPVFDVLPQGD